MIWNSASDFFAMGGYGLYVWGSFGVCALALALEPLLVSRRHNAVMQSLRDRARANKFDKEDRQ
jgi:heme exporter protein D